MFSRLSAFGFRFADTKWNKTFGTLVKVHINPAEGWRRICLFP